MEIVKKFDELRGILKELITNVDESCNANFMDSTFQLKEINNTINELKKNDISVPKELIKLKLDLLNRQDKLKIIEKTREELIDLLEKSTIQLKGAKKEKSVNKVKNEKRKTKNERVSLGDLIEARILPVNIELYAYHKKTRYSATLRSDGSIDVILDEGTRNFISPHLAIAELVGYKIDPWRLWRLDFEGKPQYLDDYRKLFLKKKRKGEIFFAEVDCANSISSRKKYTGEKEKLPRIDEMIKLGLMKTGDIIKPKDREGQAVLINNGNVLVNEAEISLNKWLKNVFGWSSICIYKYAVHKESGKTLSQIREEYMNKQAAEN